MVFPNRMRQVSFQVLCKSMFLVAMSCSAAWGQEYMCADVPPPGPGSYGPFDYRTEKDKLPIVERVHFTSHVEQLKGGATTASPAPDIAYTLDRFPNHHRALMAMIRLSEREKVDRPRQAPISTPCYLDRASRWRPDDRIVHVLYGTWLARHDKPVSARRQLELAIGDGNDDPNVTYNAALAYFELKDYKKSLELAHAAYSMGYPLPGLRRKLEGVGKWQDPVKSSPPAEVSAATMPPAADVPR